MEIDKVDQHSDVTIVTVKAPAGAQESEPDAAPWLSQVALAIDLRDQGVILGSTGISLSDYSKAAREVAEQFPDLTMQEARPGGGFINRFDPLAVAAVRFALRHDGFAEAGGPTETLHIPGTNGRGKTKRVGRKAIEGIVTNDFIDFAGDLLSHIDDEAKLADPESRSPAQDFMDLVKFFGVENASDILMTFRPEYKGVPVSTVKGFLNEYLGRFLVNKGELNLDRLSLTVEHLGDPRFKTALTEVLKKHCLSSYNKVRSENPTNSDEFEIIAEYLDGVRDKSAGLGSLELTEVVWEIENYYLEVFQLQESKAGHRHLVGNLAEGRPFPDLNQAINIHELMHKKRLLIGDDPGMGKSAAVILAKELHAIGPALIIAPSNVVNMNVWQKYLSPALAAEDSDAKSYFTSDETPRNSKRYYTVDCREDVDALWKYTQENGVLPYDYVIVSHERLDDNSVGKLKHMGFEMLVVDEVHMFKNLSDGKRSYRLLELAEAFEEDEHFVALLSATPAPNQVSDIAVMLKLLYPDIPDIKQIDSKALIHSIVKGDFIGLRLLLTERMQLKRLEESLPMPPLIEEVIEFELSDAEKQIYEIILDEEDELTASEKIILLRRLVMNTQLVDSTPDIPTTKPSVVSQELHKTFSTKQRVIMFVNDFVEGLLKDHGDHIPLADLFGLPADVQVNVIHGDVSQKERTRLQHEFQDDGNKQKMLLIVNGQTGALGVDFSAADELYEFNEPWTQQEKRQQIGRGFRPGRPLDHELIVKTFIAKGSIEEGISLYIKAKDQIIQKLLHGVPLTEIEEERLLSEDQADDNKIADDQLLVNPELARSYMSYIQRLNKIFAHAKEAGSHEFIKLLAKYGVEYAETYRRVSDRSYQANVGRLVGGSIESWVKSTGRRPDRLKIIDVGSGPEMLKRRLGSDFDQAGIVSLDLNRQHFDKTSTNALAGNALALPFADKSADVVNMSLVLHHSRYLIKQRLNLERLQMVSEASRVLKVGGRLLCTLPHSMEFSNIDRLDALAGELGLRLIKNESGTALTGNRFKSPLYVFEKVLDLSVNPYAVPHENLAGLKFGVVQHPGLRTTRSVLDEFRLETLGGQSVPIKKELNANDRAVKQQEQALMKLMCGLRDRFGSVKAIPAEEIEGRDLARYNSGNKGYVLFGLLQNSQGALIVRDDTQFIAD